MMKIKTNFAIVGLMLTAMSLSGCIPQAAPLDQKTYMLDAKYQGAPATSYNAVLQVNNTTIAEAFADNQFVYRTSDSSYQKDFYNLFFVPPAQQIEELLTSAVDKAQLFTDIEQPGTVMAINYVLKSNVDTLYADYRDAKNPQGVISITTSLYYNSNKGPQRIFSKSYKQSSPINPENSDGLMKAWNADLTVILTQVIGDMKHALNKQEAIHTAEAAPTQPGLADNPQ
ncbi:MAG: ABC-type transport auxiliary lipoprotein family protein [Gammaproteobacteria bacterium]|nr:ABC-type transport auxiliary lipoprotein family protein [Gammaproteobacteria bacterium]